MRDGPGASSDVAVWPEHEKAVSVFAALLTQWRVGPGGGVIGLDYAAIPPVLSMMAVPRRVWPDVFEMVRVMEGEAVNVINERQ